MATGSTELGEMPVVRNLQDFDANSGNALERLIFNNRMWMVLACTLMTFVLGYFAVTRLTLNASFEKMIPQSQPYIKNYLDNQKELRGLGNAIRVVVENTEGDIFDPKYLDVLKQINDELFLMPGVDRAWMKSLWTPAVRWTEVTEEGFQGGPVMPDNYDGSPASVQAMRDNLARSGAAQSLLSKDMKSSMIFVPLLDKDPNTGERLNYRAFSDRLEKNVRDKYELAKSLEKNIESRESGAIKIRVIGFAKLIGELIDGLVQVMLYFAAAAVIASIILFMYTRCIRSTFLLMACSIIAVVWQLGIVALSVSRSTPIPSWCLSWCLPSASRTARRR